MNFKQNCTCICQMGNFDKQTIENMAFLYLQLLSHIHMRPFLYTFNLSLVHVTPTLFNHALHPHVFFSPCNIQLFFSFCHSHTFVNHAWHPNVFLFLALCRSSSWIMEESNTKDHRTTSHEPITIWRWSGRRRWDGRVWQRMCGPLKAALRWSERAFEGSVQESSRWSVTPTLS